MKKESEFLGRLRFELVREWFSGSSYCLEELGWWLMFLLEEELGIWGG